MWLPAAAGFGCFMIKTKEILVEEYNNVKKEIETVCMFSTAVLEIRNAPCPEKVSSDSDLP